MNAKAEDDGAEQDHEKPKDEVSVLERDGACFPRDENAGRVKDEGQKDHGCHDANTCSMPQQHPPTHTHTVTVETCKQIHQ